MKSLTFAAAVGGLCALLTSATHGQVRIMEVDSETPGTDTLEFIELYDGGVGNTSLTGLVVVLFNGSAANNASYLAVDLDGKTTNGQGYFLVGNSAVIP